MAKFISKKHLEVCNNLSYDLGFNQTINPELFQYLPNTFFIRNVMKLFRFAISEY